MPKTPKKTRGNSKTTHLTDEEILRTFQQLHLVDPANRNYFQQLSTSPTEEPLYWTELHSHTNIDSPDRHDA